MAGCGCKSSPSNYTQYEPVVRYGLVRPGEAVVPGQIRLVYDSLQAAQVAQRNHPGFVVVTFRS